MNEKRFFQLCTKMSRESYPSMEDLEEIIKNAEDRQTQILMSIILSKPKYVTQLSFMNKRNSVNSLFQESDFPIFELNQEFPYEKDKWLIDLNFLVTIFIVCKKKLSGFLSAKLKFENLYLNGSISEAKMVLDDVFREQGYSLWYIEMRLLLLNDLSFSKYEEEYHAIKDACENRMVQNHIRLIKRMINKRTSYDDLLDFFNDNFDTIEDESEIIYRDFVLFHCLNRTTPPPSEIIWRNVMITAYSAPLFDAYLLIERMLKQRIAENPQKTKYEKDLLNKMFFAIRPDSIPDYNMIGKLKQQLCVGDTRACFENCKTALNNNAAWMEIYVIQEMCRLLLNEIKNNPSETNISGVDETGFNLNVSELICRCWTKNGESTGMMQVIDRCDRILRSFSSFEGFYELNDFIRMAIIPYGEKLEYSFWMKMVSRRYQCEEHRLLPEMDWRQSGTEGNKLKKSCYIAEWNKAMWMRCQEAENACFDPFCVILNEVRQNPERGYKSESNFSREVILRQEWFAERCNLYVEQEKYDEAIHLYVEAYLQNEFYVLKIDEEKLKRLLLEKNLDQYYTDVDFFLFANYAELDKRFPGEISQVVMDSYYSILRDHGVNVPSELCEKGKVEWKPERLLAFLDLCTAGLLSQPPSNLYDEDQDDELEKILNYLYEKRQEKKYKRDLGRLSEKKQVEEIAKVFSADWIPEGKIIFGWIKLKFGNEIVQSFQALKGLTANDIIREEESFAIFKNALLSCKKEYIELLNNQLGSTIRHGTIEDELGEILKIHHLDFASGLPADAMSLEAVIMRKLEKGYKRLVQGINIIKQQYIFFRSQRKEYGSEKKRNYTSLYMNHEEIQKSLKNLHKVEDEITYKLDLQHIIEIVVEEKSCEMGETVCDQLKKEIALFCAYMNDHLNEDELNWINVGTIDTDFDNFLDRVRRMFKVVKDMDTKYPAGRFLDDVREKYPEIDLHHDLNGIEVSMKVLLILKLIIENLKNNMNRHSGMGLENCQGKIFFTFDPSSDTFTITSENRVNISLSEYLKNRIDNTNQLIRQVKGSNEREQSYIPLSSFEDEAHGKGYQRIAKILNQHFNIWNVTPDLHEDRFNSVIYFSMGEKDYANLVD